ncbi:4'-phosphopantetheinyl transferase family protein [Pedobacter antarcticus]|nr:4'-phosphopantetheinyl transferase superfamily protein [Pedobacter antarcticus]
MSLNSPLPVWKSYAGELLSLENEVHIFKFNLKDFGNLDYREALSQAEFEKASKYHRTEDKEAFLRRRYLLKKLLGAYLQIPSNMVEFAYSVRKKPSVKGGVEFSLSHSKDYVLVALSNQAIGIDIEWIDPSFEFNDIAINHFHPEEVGLLRNSMTARSDFYTIWTRKESILKATAEGLIMAMNLFSVTPGSITRNNNVYHFQSYQTIQKYQFSLALPADLNCSFWEIRSLSFL